DYKPAVEGRGQIGFGAYSNGVWLIAGAASVDILGGLVSGEADMFASASGFAASFRTATPIPLDGMGFLTLEETEATVFFASDPHNTWGGTASITAGVRPIPFLPAPVAATLEGAILIEGLNPKLYAVAGLEVNYLLDSWKGSVWAKAQSTGGQWAWSGGPGRDPSMDDALAEMSSIAGQLEDDKASATAAVASAKEQSPTFTLTAEERLAAYERMNQLFSHGNVSIGGLLLLGTLTSYENHGALQAEKTYRTRYLDAVSDRTSPARPAAGDATSLLAQLDANASVVQSRIRSIRSVIGSYDAEPVIPRGSPVGITVPPSPFGTGRQPARQDLPRLTLNPGALNALHEALQAHEADVASYDARVREQLEQMEDVLASVRAATTDAGAGSLLHYARLHSRAREASEQDVARSVEYLMKRQDWAEQESNWVAAAWANTARMTEKTQRLMAGSDADQDALWELARVRVDVL